jgi:PAZ domain
LEDFQSVEQPRQLSYDDINQMDFNRDAYYHRVINPVYREDEPRYVVIDVREDLSPLSQFLNGEYPSYKDYFETKFYDLNITQLDQP